ncbi:MAG: glycosyltransferase family 2 protein [Ramlibacter sp.]|nr:glycosyltransferase family 2 protein [Ramlibacter sp.]
MPKIAVVTPYFKESLEVLAQCHASVLSQGVDADHFLVADGFAKPEIATWKARHVTLPSSHGDAGGTPRGIGGMLAASEGYDFVTYLDADNWFHPGHLASLLDVHSRTNSPVCTSWRTFHRPDGSDLRITEPAEDELRHVDTNCYFIHRIAFEVLGVWLRTPKQLALIGDAVFLSAIRHARFPIVPTRQRSVAYRTTHEFHFRLAGEPPPEAAKPLDMVRPAQQWLLTKEGVDESVRCLGFWPASYM